MFHVKHGPKPNLKYPLILVHGAGFRDRSFGLNYWGRIPRCLQERGIVPYYGGTDAWGTIETNGELLRQRILEVLAETGVEKVNLLAHSKGGLECRYVISVLGMASRVAALVTMSTPHRGVRAMDVALKFPVWMYRLVSLFVDLWCKILGDGKPDFFTASRQLSERYCTEFNRGCRDRKEVYYRSYTTRLRYFFGDLNYLFTWLLVKVFDGDNDGLCPVESAKWGDFRGVITTQGLFGISHGGILDLYRIRYKGVDVPELYANVAQELAEKGF